MRNPWPARLLLLLAAAACIPLYWPGLHGPFLFDDIPNLGLVQLWLEGGAGWRTVVFDNLAGPLGRPLSMATFLTDGALWGMNPFGFKLTNLGLHLVIGLAIYLLVHRIARRDPQLGGHPRLVAAVVSAIWLLHPLHAGTVLYVVQRMAMLSALFIVLAMLAYLHGRERIERGDLRAGMIWLFGVVPVLTVLGAFSKENGVLALLLCGVVEWVYFRPAAGTRRPTGVRVFQIALVAAPIALGLVLLVAKPDLFLDGYANRPFTLVQRLLTESRVLFDYLGKLLLPVGHQFSIMRDDYTISTGLLSPPTTALALAGWIGLVVAAIRLRTVLPSFSAGIGIYLAGHAIESGVFPLMVYFEHRNYLPSIGVLLALAGLATVIARHAAPKMDHPRPVGVTAVALLLLTLAFATHGRALVWQTKELLIHQSLQNFPDSRFVRAEMAALEMNRPFPDVEAAREHFRYLADSERPLTRMNGRLGLIKIDCLVDGRVSDGALQRTFEIQPRALEADLVMSLRGLINMARDSDCEGLGPARIAELLATWLDRIAQPESLDLKARLRIETARLFAFDGQFRRALEQARHARASGLANADLALLIASMHLELGEYADAARLLGEAEPGLDRSDEVEMRRYRDYRAAVRQALGAAP